MKNTYIYIVIIALLMGGILFSGKSKIGETKTLGAETGVGQVIKATYGPPLGFSPTELIVKAGEPVRLEVTATINGRGCMNTVTIPGLDSSVQTLVKNETNIFEFTPQTPGEYPITCAMGMTHGAVIIVQ